FQIDIAVDFEVVDPDIDQAGGAVGIENDQIDMRFAGVNFGAELRPQHASLLLKQAADIANAKLLPLADVGIHVASKQRRNRLPGAAVEVPRKHDAGHKLQARPVGFDKQCRLELLN